jgi:hypothetical protein
VIGNDHCKQAKLSGFRFREFFKKKNKDVKVYKFYVSFNKLQKRLRLTQNKTKKKKSVGNVAAWPCGCVAMWPSGHVAMWLRGYVAMWLCGYVAMWLCGQKSVGNVAVCPCGQKSVGNVGVWPCGHVAM